MSRPDSPKINLIIHLISWHLYVQVQPLPLTSFEPIEILTLDQLCEAATKDILWGAKRISSKHERFQ
jgi:hypothetical protein